MDSLASPKAPPGTPEPSPPAPVDVRVLFAAERTFLAWLRTGLSLMGFGFVVARFGLFLRELAAGRGEQVPAGQSRWFGIALVALGTTVVLGALRQHYVRVRQLHAGVPMSGRPSTMQVAVSVLLIVAGTFLTAYLIVASSASH